MSFPLPVPSSRVQHTSKRNISMPLAAERRRKKKKKKKNEQHFKMKRINFFDQIFMYLWCRVVESEFTDISLQVPLVVQSFGGSPVIKSFGGSLEVKNFGGVTLVVKSFGGNPCDKELWW